MYWTPDPDRPLTKVCTKCKTEKHFMEFYILYHRGRRRPDCKECRLAVQRRYYARNAAACREYSRRYRAAHPERVRELHRDWLRRHPDWQRARWPQDRERHPRRRAIRRATRALYDLGLIEADDRCADCGGGPIELHHPDYDDPWRVVPLCRPCHMRRHHAAWRRTGGGPVKYPEEYGSGERKGEEGAGGGERRPSRGE